MSGTRAEALRDELSHLQAYLEGLPAEYRVNAAFDAYRRRFLDLRRELHRAELEARLDDPDFESLFRTRYREVHTFFREERLSAEDATELTLRVFARVYTQRKVLRGDPEKDLVLMTAQEIWREALWHRASAARRATAAATRRVASTPLTLDERAELRRMVTQLPLETRRVAKLYYGQGLSQGDVAGVMQLSLEAARSLVEEARERSMVGRRVGGAG